MSQSGGCLCGNVRYTVEGDPVSKGLCHCTDCRKITGSAYSTNVIYHPDSFAVTKGTAKQYSFSADSGNTISIYFCGDCGSTMWSEPAMFAGLKIIKAGTLDAEDALQKSKPALEIYSRARPDWIAAVEGAEQNEAMPMNPDLVL
ncbi:hypothetical protein M011DRAFT_439231 [Sporormia fimetaria CBS 119925]|uniref:CENP-V/GFA domain-containing protein n=1 Tax=Sporormia fimetaria CBS 119925 TaxID=1340428 RepID=A0A6A6VJY0_9PLEO|nr:hypothetical protein M011DRAFT_439231 [Sporormia fimetaria CBS 119925]